MKVIGSKISYGTTPTLYWSINKPQTAKEVIEVNNLASLEIKIDSTIKVEAIGIGLNERNDQSRATIYVNGSGSLFYLGSQHTIYNITDHKKTKKLSWPDFYKINRNMIHSVPLTEAQAFGTKNTPRYKIPYEKLEDLKKLGRIVIQHSAQRAAPQGARLTHDREMTDCKSVLLSDRGAVHRDHAMHC